MKELLIELFSEEIPARMQAKAADNLRRLMTDKLVEAGLTYASAAAFSTPRRLALVVEGLSEASPERKVERKGPKVGAPDKAVDGFARSAGVERAALETRADKKGEVYFASTVYPGRSAAEITAEALEETIRNFPWPKSMRWGAGALRWVRPLHSILCILSDEGGVETVPASVGDIKAGATSRGHRFMGPEVFSVTSFGDYEAKLKQNHVLLRHEQRAEIIWQEASNMAFAQGLDLVEDKALLAEVAGLVEWPVVLIGPIGAAFMELPSEVLQTSMREHQKFFSVRNPKSNQIEHFVTVANIAAKDGGAAILAGNGKVLRARLSDAKFFWNNDLRIVADAGLTGMGAGLANVTFHNKLGTQADRVARISALVPALLRATGADRDSALTAARICKSDLQSEMVGEFPELQGLMGRYYAKAEGLNDSIAAAVQEHYAPLGPSDDVPTAPVSVTVALADKIDTLTGFWAIDEKPTGSKDPFALRRAALGVIRLIISNDLRLSLKSVFEAQALRLEWLNIGPAGSDNDSLLDDFLELIAEHGVFGAAWQSIREKMTGDDLDPIDNAAKAIPDLGDDFMGFIHDRLKVYLRDAGVRHDVIDACLAMPGNDDLTALAKRAKTLSALLGTDDGENLIQGFKRANNILSQAEAADGVEYSYGADVKFAEADSEKALFAALDQAEEIITPAIKAEDYEAAMSAMAALRQPIDAFFDSVQINTDNSVLRRNRLNLLSRIRSICLTVADLTMIEG